MGILDSLRDCLKSMQEPSSRPPHVLNCYCVEECHHSLFWALDVQGSCGPDLRVSVHEAPCTINQTSRGRHPANLGLWTACFSSSDDWFQSSQLRQACNPANCKQGIAARRGYGQSLFLGGRVLPVLRTKDLSDFDLKSGKSTR